MNLQNIDASAIIAIVILAFVVIGFIKGLIRTILTLISLCISTYIAWLGFGYIQEITYNDYLIPAIGSLIIWVAIFILCKRIFRFIINPFNSSKTGKKIGDGKPAALFSLLAILLTVWVSLTGIRYAGAIADLRNTQSHLKGLPTKSRDTLVIGLQTILDNSIIGEWHLAIDPVNSKAKLAMAKIMLMYHDKPMRAKMFKTPIFDSILNNHRFLEIAYLDSIKDNTLSGDFIDIYNHELVAEVIAEEPLKSELEVVQFFHESAP